LNPSKKWQKELVAKKWYSHREEILLYAVLRLSKQLIDSIVRKEPIRTISSEPSRIPKKKPALQVQLNKSIFLGHVNLTISMDQQGAIDQERNFSVSNLTGLH
jgi:hypothetical protein